MLPDDIRERVVSYIRHQAGKPGPEIATLVAESQATFLDTVGPADDDTASRNPADGEWCLRELVRHVIGAQLGVAELVHSLARGERPAPGGRGIGMMAEDQEQPFAALVAEVRQANETMLAAINGLPADANTTLQAPHPWFGDLNCREWAVFQRVHDADHIQHAQKILASVTHQPAAP